MFTMEESIVIDRPVEAVFAFVSDIVNDPKYRQDVLEAKWTSEGAIGSGRTFEHLLNFMGHKRIKGRVTEYRPNELSEVQYISGSIRPIYRITFEPTGTGTRITHHSDVQIFGLLRLLEPLMPGMAKGRVVRDYENLKRLLEG
ncbi:MAG: SRPBCC family protein [Chloroflexi bacterium]|nr:SRPBCC family protein [Chloroflexota bacterium]MCI0575896.1 SRPBCC family protein [Chloroflexota bacterium]MCI0648309.1 SRPBCC family protein [Chloroflexota bacterium]MCI0727710.1 SRPBCC family protein [Chloroflexota bacterium]